VDHNNILAANDAHNAAVLLTSKSLVCIEEKNWVFTWKCHIGGYNQWLVHELTMSRKRVPHGRLQNLISGMTVLDSGSKIDSFYQVFPGD